MFSLICARINGWVNNPEAGDLKRHPTHCDVIVICIPYDPMVTSRHGNAFVLLRHLWGESTGDHWIPLAKRQLCQPEYVVEQTLKLPVIDIRVAIDARSFTTFMLTPTITEGMFNQSSHSVPPTIPGISDRTYLNVLILVNMGQRIHAFSPKKYVSRVIIISRFIELNDSFHATMRSACCSCSTGAVYFTLTISVAYVFIFRVAVLAYVLLTERGGWLGWTYSGWVYARTSQGPREKVVRVWMTQKWITFPTDAVVY